MTNRHQGCCCICHQHSTHLWTSGANNVGRTAERALSRKGKIAAAFHVSEEVVNGPHLPCTLDRDWLDVSQRRRFAPQ